MSANWDRACDSQGDDEQDWSSEFEERFPAGEQPETEGDSTAAAGDAEEIAGASGDQNGPNADSASPGPYHEPEARSTGPAAAAQPGAGQLDFSAGLELSRRPLGWNGKPKGRSLVKPDEVRLAFSPHERLLDSGYLAAERPAGGGLRALGRAVEAHLISVEEAVRPARPGGAGRAAAGRQDRQQAVGGDPADDRDAQAGASRVGLPADQR